ncbi:hypothetical protein [Rhodococcus sp. ARC_M6]|uniref:hypothetical protein n=1 Tax=Rhodococcus sp. ARC_M6 TaxID=2928852 RepID=UPI001FB4F877|nr:hypothetical protein [Rhodococcus sp. ARC_M6]MCJ0907051.1 hypothetical protein [Rhodococcus sp. ARC_M6]
MRMHIYAAGIIATALVLSACGSSNDDSDSNSPATVAVPNTSANGTQVAASEPAILKPGDKTGISLGSTRGTATLESIQTNIPCGAGENFYQALEFTVTLDPGTSFMTAASLELTEILPDGSQATSKSNISINGCLSEDEPVLDTIRHGSTQRGWIVAKTKQDGGSLYFHTDSQNNMDSIIEF